MLIEVHMEGRTTSKMLDIRCTMEFELVNDGQRVILYHIEIAVIAVAWYKVTILTIPLSMLHTYVFGRNHLAVEHHVLRAILTIILFYQSEDTLYKVQIFIVRCNLQSHELSSLNESVDTDGQILTGDIDITSIKQWEHTMGLEFLQVLIVSQLYLVA